MSAVRWISATVLTLTVTAAVFGIGAGTSAASAGQSVTRASGPAACPAAMGWEGTSCP